MSVDDDTTPLPPGLDLLWGRRERARRGPKPALSVEAIVEAAMAVADSDGIEAVSMARVAKELGYTTMALYRHVDSKDQLLQLMWDSSAIGAPVIAGETWRERLEAWALGQQRMLSERPWLVRMPLATPPAGPASLAWVEQAMAALDGTGLEESEKFGVIGLLSTFALGEARLAADAAAAQSGDGPDPWDYGALLRTLVDEPTYPHLHRAAHSGDLGSEVPSADPEADPSFRFGLDLILDGVEALIARRASHP